MRPASPCARRSATTCSAPAARAQLAAAAVHVLPGAVADLGQHATAVQAADDLADALGIGALVIIAFQAVEGNDVEHAVLALEQAHDGVELVVAVVDALEQRPLILDRIARVAGVLFAEFDQRFGRDSRRARQQVRAQFRLGRVATAPAFDALPGQRLEHARVAHRREHQVLVADAALGAEQIDGFEHVLEIVRRLAHAHENHLLHRAHAPRQHHLGQDLHAGDLPDQAALAGHAEATAHRAADLGRDAKPIARQQHAFHHLPVGQFDQQARAIVAGMLGSDAGQAVQLRRQGGHGVAQRQRQEVLGVAPPRALVQRLALQPDAHEPAAMHGQGIKGGETLVEVGVAHGERGGRRQMLVAWPVQSSELMSLQITRL